ncbi:MAG TPA: flagellar export chaperone FlgN [Syntrophorhabdaceae bacterium]|nr:flagellar export chaperone FlgN [Syntrophorhabdaceae bacterium]
MEHVLFEIASKELSLLKDFQKTLKEERDCIIAFSIEGIVRTNNKKEELLKKLEFIESEKTRLMEKIPDREKLFNDMRWKSVTDEIKAVLKDINMALGKNIDLLSFSVDYVRNTIENIVDFVNRTTYTGKGHQRLSVFPSREI